MFSIINTSVKRPVTGDFFAQIITHGKLTPENAHFVFAFFNELSAESIWRFCIQQQIKLAV